MMTSTVDLRCRCGEVRGWKLRGQTWPHPFFDGRTRAPIYSFTVLSHDEHEALHSRCGPRPAK